MTDAESFRAALDDVAARFTAAARSGDRGAARGCCAPGGLVPGETPAALFLDAVEHGYGIEVTGEARVVGERGAVPVAVVKAGHAPRDVWLLAEEEGRRVGLAGVTGSRKVVEAFLSGIAPANAALGRLPESPRGARFGAGIVEAFARHGKVSEAFGAMPIAAKAAGWMLDGMLASPGAQIAVSETRELAGAARAAVCFEVSRPELSLPEDLWVVLELGDGREVVRATASSMSLEVLLSGVTPQTLGASAPSGSSEPPPLVVPDRIDALIEGLRGVIEAASPPADDAASGATAQAGSLLDRELRERIAHDPAAAEAVRELLEKIAAHLPKRAPEEDLRAWVQRLLDEMVAGLGRTIGSRSGDE